MEDDRLKFMRKLLALCKEYRVDLGVLDVYRDESLWIYDLTNCAWSRMIGCWDAKEYEVP